MEARRAPARPTRAITVAVVLLAAAVAALGGHAMRPRAEDASSVKPAPAVVGLAPLEAVDRTAISRRFVGRVEAAASQVLAFERAGTLVAAAAEEGDRVTEGEMLAMLDDRAIVAQLEERQAGRRALEAQVELAELTAGRRDALEARGFSPAQAADEARLELEGLRARIAEADAAIAGLRLDLEKSVLTAPYDGWIGQRRAEPGATLAPGEAVLSILKDAPPRMRVGLPPDLADDVSPGDALEAVIGGRRVPAIVLRIRPDLDPVTLTRAVVLELATEEAADGLTGTVTVPEEIVARGAWVPVAALREGERGLWMVLSPGPEGVLRALAVEVLAVEGERAFVSGPFEPGARIVARGVHRVSPGQAVAAGG